MGWQEDAYLRSVHNQSVSLPTARGSADAARIPQRTDKAVAPALEAADAALEAANRADPLPATPPLSGVPLPQGILLTARHPAVGGVEVVWNPPTTGNPDYISRARVRYRTAGASVWLESEADPMRGANLKGLPEDTAASPKTYEAQAAFIDRYERQSAWSATVSSVAETYIPRLSADRITSGMMTTSTFTLAGTEVSGNKAQMVFVGDAVARFNDGAVDRIKISKDGMELAPAVVETTRPADVYQQSVSATPLSDGERWGSLFFYRVPSANRGAQLRADGKAGTVNVVGEVGIVATTYPEALPSETSEYGSIFVRTGLTGSPVEGLAGARIRHALHTLGPGLFDGTLVAASFRVQFQQTKTIGAGQFDDFFHEFGEIPTGVQIYGQDPSNLNRWYPYTAIPLVYEFATPSLIRVTNNGTAGRVTRVSMYKG